MYFATFSKRVIAFLIDGALIFSVGLLPASVVLLTGMVQQSSVAFLASAVVAWILMVLTSFFYGFLTLQRSGFRNGQTLGKQWMKIRVVKTDLSDFGTKDVWKREVGAKFLVFFFVSLFTYTILGWINFLWPLWDTQKKALHDKMCKTLVVDAGLGTGKEIEQKLKSRELQLASNLFDIQKNGVLEEYFAQSKQKQVTKKKSKSNQNT